MNTKILFATLVTAGLATTASAAHAGGIKIGAQAQILPAGSELTGEELDGDEFSVDAEPAFGVVGTFDYAVHPNIDIGLAPRIVIGLKGEDDDDSATQFDLAARVTGHAQVAPKVDVFGFVAPGYSILSMPDWPDDVDSPSGLVLGLGAGAGYAVTPKLSIVGEVGYQLGFQGFSVGDRDITAQTDLLHLGVGIKAAL